MNIYCNTDALKGIKLIDEAEYYENIEFWGNTLKLLLGLPSAVISRELMSIDDWQFHSLDTDVLVITASNYRMLLYTNSLEYNYVF